MPLPKYLCIHGHFYQPPRENPWLEAVEVQDSAYPYHNWNERITVECYGPNRAARISTWDGTILDIRNNYEKISFNFGPTLLHWIADHRPEVYEDIIAADRVSVDARSGHGNALAQPYNHTILPLASAQEKRVQVLWGLEDFRRRFGRDPQGMWLPECAVDLDTLSELALNGIGFTILAPSQARRFRLLDSTEGWRDADGAIDPTRPYLCTLPNGHTIALFFYDGPISQAVAFEGLLNDGNTFAHRMMQGFSEGRSWPQLVSLATDGESYGHHHRHGEMALAYAMHVVERENLARLTNFGEYLSLHPPMAEVQIWNDSSWSCVHGVERWKSDCGCSSGMNGGWHQRWRSPLREAFRLLAGAAEETYAAEAKRYFRDPRRTLEDYSRIMTDRRPAAVRQFLAKHAAEDGPVYDATGAIRLLEIMRNKEFMFTSCAWFFDEVSGIEATQNMKYAARLIQLLRPWHPSIEADFLDILRRAPSNIPHIRNAAEAYRRFVQPGVIDLHRVLAHHALCSIHESREGTYRLFCYEITERDAATAAFGNTHFKMSRLSALSLIDGEQADMTAVVLHFGGSDFRCSLTAALPFGKYLQVREDLLETLRHRSTTRLVRQVDEYFGHEYFTLHHLFSEGKRDLLQRITDESFRRFDDSITFIYEENRKFMDFLLAEGAPLPQAFVSAADFVLRTRLLEQLERFLETADPAELQEIADEAARYKVHMRDEIIVRRFNRALERSFYRLAVEPSAEQCHLMLDLLQIVEKLDLRLDYSEAQNVVFALVHNRPLPAYLAAQVPRATNGRGPLEPSPALRTLAERLQLTMDPVSKTLGLSLLPNGRASSEQVAVRK